MLHELYDGIGGSYENAKRRLMNDQMMERFVLRFPADPTFAELAAAMADEDADRAFAAAHTLKGIALTLAFERLGAAAAALTDALRERSTVSWTHAHALEQEVCRAYAAVIAAVEAYRR